MSVGPRAGILACAALLAVLISGCSVLPVPPTKIGFDPTSKSLSITSPKNVEIGKLELLAEGTNFTLTVTDYRSKHDAAIIQAAAAAQAKQIAASQEAFGMLIQAATGTAKP
jgi:hypothetical protein